MTKKEHYLHIDTNLVFLTAEPFKCKSGARGHWPSCQTRRVGSENVLKLDIGNQLIDSD